MYDEAVAYSGVGSSNDSSSHVMVLDTGTRWTRVGFAAEEAPRVTMPTLVGAARHAGQRTTLLQHDVDVLAGDVAACEAGLLQLRRPVQHGHVHDMDALEQLLLYTVYERLPVTPEATPFLLLEPADQHRRTRERVAELLFESIAAPLAATLNTLSATVYAGGRTTGVAVDSGAGKTCVGVVVGGYALSHALRSTHVAGDYLTDALFARLRGRGYALSTRRDWERVERLKETLCYASVTGSSSGSSSSDGGVEHDAAAAAHSDVNATATIATAAAANTTTTTTVDGGPYMTLPDGEHIFVFDDSHLLAERLFAPARHIAPAQHSALRPRSPYGYNTRNVASAACCGDDDTNKSNSSSSTALLGWPEAVDEVVAMAPSSLHSELYGNVVLGGGTTMLRNVERRLQRELAQRQLDGSGKDCRQRSAGDAATSLLASQQQQQQQHAAGGGNSSSNSHASMTAMRVNCVAFPERAYAAWLGGSVWASSNAFAQLCVSKAQYHEEGAGVVHQHAF